MTSDLRALLGAIVADPSDDVARLVYADCLEEHGNAARAAFIRLQIEAERFHPHSKQRADLDRRAEELLEANWTAWWAEVCAAVSFWAPQPKPTSRLGQLASRIGLRSATGDPYCRQGFTLRTKIATNGLPLVTYCRGFPDALELTYWATSFLADWPKAAPLYSITATPPYIDNRFDGRHLAGVQTIDLRGRRTDTLQVILESHHLPKLAGLRLRLCEYSGRDTDTFFAEELASVVREPRMRQLKKLAIPVYSDSAAEMVAGATNLVGLESLDVSILHDHSDDVKGGGRRLAMLARSPHLSGLKELTVRGWTDSAGLAAAICNPVWSGLRKLELHGLFGDRILPPLADSTLFELDDLALGFVPFSEAVLALLVRSALPKRVRHLTLRGSDEEKRLLSAMTEIPDAERIETFALHLYHGVPNGIREALRAKFGDRVRLLHS